MADLSASELVVFTLLTHIFCIFPVTALSHPLERQFSLRGVMLFHLR